MLDHLFLDTVSTLKAALDANLLERSGQDDRLVYDLLTGDLVWETSVSLPGDGDPPRVSADLSLDWQTWSQSAWRSMNMGEPVEDLPEVGIEVVFRAQRLASRPPLATVLAVLPGESPDIGGDHLTRSAPVIEEAFEDEGVMAEVAVEVAYEGSFRLPTPGGPEAGKEASGYTAWPGPRPPAPDPLGREAGTTRQVSPATEATLAALGSWLASTLVRLADLDLEYLPPQPEPDTP
jgi:hypothetical protein